MAPNSPTRVLIYGAGVIGSLYGVYLSRIGCEVSVLARVGGWKICFKRVSCTGIEIGFEKRMSGSYSHGKKGEGSWMGLLKRQIEAGVRSHPVSAGQ